MIVVRKTGRDSKANNYNPADNIGYTEAISRVFLAENICGTYFYVYLTGGTYGCNNRSG